MLLLVVVLLLEILEYFPKFDFIRRKTSSSQWDSEDDDEDDDDDDDDDEDEDAVDAIAAAQGASIFSQRSVANRTGNETISDNDEWDSRSVCLAGRPSVCLAISLSSL